LKWLSDATLAHLCKVTALPELGGTRYELVEKLGQGGMGVVYLARDRELERPVALKVLNAAPEDPEVAARMAREARILARLEHPSIVPVHDCGVLPDGRFYYAMKLVRGKRLDEHAAQPGERAERLALFQKICDAVAFAHAHGVVHRDLKPQNVMLGAFGEVLVMDWGVAKEVVGRNAAPSGRDVGVPPGGGAPAHRPGQTLHGTVLGTPGYMAPEQARGEVELIDERADVYALGGILFFLLTGRDPQPEQAGGREVTPPQRLNRSIPRALNAVCLKALAAEPSARYAAVPELADDVAAFLAGRRVAAYREGPLRAGLRVAKQYRTVLFLVLAYLLMRVLLLIFASA
jgi:serine/threonine protein kinase